MRQTNVFEPENTKVSWKVRFTEVSFSSLGFVSKKNHNQLKPISLFFFFSIEGENQLRQRKTREDDGRAIWRCGRNEIGW